VGRLWVESERWWVSFGLVIGSSGTLEYRVVVEWVVYGITLMSFMCQQ